jgi:hypothetical protein
MSGVHNPILGYADSYRLMVRMAEKEGKPLVVSMWSVITDLERNMAPLMAAAQSELAAEKTASSGIYQQLEICQKQRDALREDLAHFKDGSQHLLKSLTVAEQRNAELVELTKDALKAFNYHPEGSCYNPGIAFVKPWSIRAAELIKPTESGASE